MTVTWEDRVPTYPGRIKLTYEDGTSVYATLERADDPTVVGTPVNAENLNSMAADIEAAVKVAEGKASFGSGAYFTGVNLGSADATAYVYSEGGNVNFRYDNGSGSAAYTDVRGLVGHATNKSNPHGVTKAQVGLDKVNNNAIGMSLSGTTLTITYS